MAWSTRLLGGWEIAGTIADESGVPTANQYWRQRLRPSASAAATATVRMPAARCTITKKRGQVVRHQPSSRVPTAAWAVAQPGLRQLGQGRGRWSRPRQLHHFALQVVCDDRAGALRTPLRIVQHLQPHAVQQHSTSEHATATSARSPIPGIRVPSNWAASSFSKATLTGRGGSIPAAPLFIFSIPFSCQLPGFSASFRLKSPPGRWMLLLVFPFPEMTIPRLTSVVRPGFNLPRPKECDSAHILLKRLSKRIPKSISFGNSSSRERIKQPFYTCLGF